MPKFIRKVLDNGMTILFEKRELPVVSIAFAIRAGGINEVADERGISHFIEHMLYKGTPSRDARKIAEEIEKNGGILNGFTDEEVTAFWCKIPSRHLDLALDVLGDMIKNPLFNSKEIEKEKKVIFEEIKMITDNPLIYSRDKISGCLYKGILEKSLIGDEKTLSSITREKLISRFRQIYQPNNMILCVVGDADLSSLVRFAERSFKKESGFVPESKIVLNNAQKTECRRGVTQSNFIFAHHVPLAGDKKSYAAEVLNTILADGMSSRLFHELREKRNLAYAVKGGCEINKHYAYNFVYVGTDKKNLEKVKEVILGELKKISKNLEKKELNQSKEQIIGNHQISTEDSQAQMAYLISEELAGNIDEYYNYEKNISQVNLEDVKELAKKACSEYSSFTLIPK
ncbi:MAG: insulinase family protein [Nanoarchaeota archaeon]|nr:insulinase family protein [Nanoarchaeota archaeon]